MNQVARLRLEYDDEPGDLPRSIIVKLPSRDLVLKTVADKLGGDQREEKWLRKSEQGDKWNRCLIEGMIVPWETGARDEQTTPP